ncbi:MAG TPA: hypothetical protein VF997_07260 [Polyangia bacterium]
MHRLIALFVLVAGCNFAVHGFDVPSVGSPSGGTGGAAGGGAGGGGGGGTTADMALGAPSDLAQATPPDLTRLPALVGDACSGQCDGGLQCMTWVPNGYCSRTCDSATNPCPTGSSCVDTGGGARYCLVDTNGGGNCARSDLTCRDCGASVCGPPGFCSGC